MSLINLLAREAWLIQAIHHEQEIDKFSVDGMSKGYQLQFCSSGSKHYFICLILSAFLCLSRVGLIAYTKTDEM